MIISLYDKTTLGLIPWAMGGHHCLAIDLGHDPEPSITKVGTGTITRLRMDLHDPKTYKFLAQFKIEFGMAYPVCTDLAVSGARHFEAKAAANPSFQLEAAQHAVDAATLFHNARCPYLIENPVSRLATLWRKPNHYFHPYQYGGYLDKDEWVHPLYPNHIVPRDAYPKKTCLWTGGKFVMPHPDPVSCHNTNSKQYLKLGGKSAKTKAIRSATPRGFAIAVYESNKNLCRRY